MSFFVSSGLHNIDFSTLLQVFQCSFHNFNIGFPIFLFQGFQTGIYNLHIASCWKAFHNIDFSTLLQVFQCSFHNFNIGFPIFLFQGFQTGIYNLHIASCWKAFHGINVSEINYNAVVSRNFVKITDQFRLP